MSRKDRHKTEFSKKLLIASYILGFTIILFAMAIQILFIIKDYQGDSGIVIALITGAFTEIATVSAFYKWKAKKENEIKLKKIFGDLYKEDEEI